MPVLYDAVLTLNIHYELTDIHWSNPSVKTMLHNLFQQSLGQSIFKVLDISPDKQQGQFFWRTDEFLYQFEVISTQCTYFFIKQYDNKVALLQGALDQLSQGVQIYDKNAKAVFFNRVTKRISGIPSDMNVEGTHLLDLYNVDESFSSALTALSTQQPVSNRVDCFQQADGHSLLTANTAYPIFQGRRLSGVVVFDIDEKEIKSSLSKMKRMQKAIETFNASNGGISFSGYTFDHIIGHSSKITSTVNLAKKVAQQDCSILLIGETGTGKEIYAQSIHRSSPRCNSHFVALNCAAVPESLIESLLFGTEKGSFTGSENRTGYFEQADGGTLFLDELNSMSLSMQSKLLRVLQEHTFRRIGGERDISSDVRIIASCNEDPFVAIEENRLRQDLFYRISTVMINLPPLREHKEDLEELIYFRIASSPYVYPFSSIASQTMDILHSYSWPGNVRELFHVVDHALNIGEGSVWLPEYLPAYLLETSTAILSIPGDEPSVVPPTEYCKPINWEIETLQSLMDQYEYHIIMQALEHFGYNISQTAAHLGILRQSLQYRIRKYGIII